MFLRQLVVILVMSLFFSCDGISRNTSATTANTTLLDSLDYTSVDQYPLFTNCEDTTDKKQQKECFETTLTTKLSNYLSGIRYKVDKRVNDSSYVDLLIDSKGVTSVICIELPTSIQKNLPGLDSIIKTSVKKIPIVKPALKRGIPVKSQYKLAVVVRTVD